MITLYRERKIMFYKYGYLITFLIYLLYDLTYIVKDSYYDYSISIREFVIMILSSLLLSFILLIWIKKGNLKTRIMKGFKLSLFWNYLILIISNGFVIYLTIAA